MWVSNDHGARRRLHPLQDPLGARPSPQPRAEEGNARATHGLSLTDIGPFRAIHSRVLRDLEMEHKTYGWPVEMVVKAVRRGYRVVEAPVTCRARRGRSKVAGTLKGSALAGYHLLFTTLKYAWRR